MFDYKFIHVKPSPKRGRKKRRNDGINEIKTPIPKLVSREGRTFPKSRYWPTHREFQQKDALPNNPRPTCPYKGSDRFLNQGEDKCLGGRGEMGAEVRTFGYFFILNKTLLAKRSVYPRSPVRVDDCHYLLGSEWGQTLIGVYRCGSRLGIFFSHDS